MDGKLAHTYEGGGGLLTTNVRSDCRLQISCNSFIIPLVIIIIIPPEVIHMIKSFL